MRHILALDQGTTSSRAIVFDHAGAVVAVAQQEFPQLFPRPGWVEHNPDDLWSSQAQVAAAALVKAGLNARDIAAIGVTNQRETTIVWERATGRPIHNAIVWQDRRTAAACDRIKARGLAPRIRRKTGLVVDAYFSATKLQWILDHVRGARARARRGELAFGTVDSWLVWNLTGGRVHVTDVSNASRTMLLNIHTGDWDDELLALFDVPRAMLPAVKSSSEVYGETAAFAPLTPALPALRRGPARSPGFSRRDVLPAEAGTPYQRLMGESSSLAGIPIAGIAGDQQAALFGQVCTRPGMVKNTYGTGCFMLMHTGAKPIRSRNQLLTTIAWRIGGRTEYALEGSVFIAGAAVQWLRDGLGLIRSSADVEALAASVPDTHGAYLVPAFAGLGAPHWDAYARGTITGLTRGTTAAHLARATLEAIAYQSADLLAAMQADSGIKLRELRVDGGACANNLLMQFQSDLLGVPVVRPRVAETTALGAAYLAGLAVGFWKSPQEIATQWQAERRFSPTMRPTQRRTLQAGWAKALARSRRWALPDA